VKFIDAIARLGMMGARWFHRQVFGWDDLTGEGDNGG